MTQKVILAVVACLALAGCAEQLNDPHSVQAAEHAQRAVCIVHAAGMETIMSSTNERRAAFVTVCQAVDVQLPGFAPAVDTAPARRISPPARG